MKKFTLTVLMAAFCLTISAQRFTDQLGRGLVVSKTYNSNYLSWRRLANEYYDVTYNVYRNGTRIATNLNNTNYTDNSSSESNTYQIAAVVNGKEQEICPAKGQWGFTDLGNDKYNSHLNITLATVYDRNGNDVSNHYEPNDAEVADLDGDGEMEIILKRLNTVDAAGVNTGTKDAKGNDIYNIYPNNSTEFVVLDAYDVNWQTGAATLMWRIDCGPNMVSTNSTEINIIAYDWDEDGKAEVVLRGADNMIVYGSDGQKRLYTIGDMTVNTRGNWMSQNAAGTNISATAYTHEGAEYLIYMNGQTGTLYQQMDYPLKRLESGETDLNAAWGDGYGHRSSKYFMGAPFLNGRKASLFLGRGIYTRHKMMALDLNNHQWSTRWTWACNNSSSPWYGNGYHNFVIADVDEDGRDEIVYGSMVIDDNGKGLSTTGYQHGDAQHISDFDPYRKGLEMYACLEDGPYYGSNYRNATTSKVYYKFTSTGDDGRCLMGNFLNDYPGSQGKSSAMGNWVSSVTDKAIDGTSLMSVDNTNTGNQHLNFIIRWDGDLCSEIFDSPGGGGGAASITKPGLSNGARLSTLDGKTNNSSKNNACFVGDIIGDWRDEVIMRIGNNTIRVYTSNFNTNYSFPSLWFDHQYRQAMVWQMHAYNQPPHLSYFLGEMEGITVAPPPLTNQNRTEVANGGTISTTAKHLLMAETGDMTVTVADGAAPYMLTVNTPTWVQGTDVNGTTGTKVRGDGSIGVTNLDATTTEIYTHTLTGGAFTGSMRLVKQGDGVLVLPDVTETYTGETNVWGGTLKFNGTLESSPVWMNRFTTLISDGGTFGGGISMDYASRLIPGENKKSSITTTNLTLNHGARLVLDVYANDISADQVNANTLTINTVSWGEYGPTYQTPVIEFVQHGNLPNGTYNLGTVGTVSGDLGDIVVEGLAGHTYQLQHAEGQLLLVVGTGQSIDVPEATITRTEMTDADNDNLYLPTVSITPNSFTLDGNTVTPSLSATFTDMNGNETELSATTLFNEDFEGSTNANDYWSICGDGSKIYSPNYANSEGKCIGLQSSSDYGDYTPIGADYTDVTNYNIEFDAYFNNASKTTDFAVMSASHFAPHYNWGYNWKGNTYTHNAYLLYLQRGENSTTFTLNENKNTTITLDNSTWYHFTLEVDVNAGTVGYNISPKGSTAVTRSGTYTLQSGESAECVGIYIRNGRYANEPGGAGIDNINIYKPNTSFYTQNYENKTDASSWTNGGGTLELVTGDAKYGKYIHHFLNNGEVIAANRSAYTLFDTDLSTSSIYAIDFDASITAGNVVDRSVTDFVLMSKGAVIPTTKNVGFGYNGDKCNVVGTNYLFRMTATNSQTFTINESSATAFLSASTWYHFNITVNTNARTAAYSITNGTTEVASGTFSIPSGTSSEVYGLFILDGRGVGDSKFDNIKIYSIPTLSSYTFTKPGTLAVTSSYEGCKPSTATYSKVGVKISNVGYATFSNSQYNLDFSDEDDLTVYTVIDKGESVHLNEVGTKQIPAGNAVMLKGATGTENYYMATIPESVPALGENDLIANSTTITGAAGNIYVLSKNSKNVVGFYKLSANGELSTGKGYLLSEGNKAKYIGFDDEDDSTGIADVDALIPSDATIFNLQGQQVIQPLKKGVYIVNGQKILVK